MSTRLPAPERRVPSATRSVPPPVCRSPWLRAGTPLLLVLAAAASATTAHAQAPVSPAPPTQRQPGDEEMIVTLRANGVQRGTFAVVRRADGDFWLRQADLPRLEIAADPQALRRWEGEAYVSVTALGGSQVRLDEALLELRLDFPSTLLQGSRIDLATLPPRSEIGAAGHSLILSYRLELRDATGQRQPAAVLDTSVAARLGGVLLRQDSHLDTAGRPRATRGATQAVWDHLPTATRVVVGDTVSSAGAYGSVITGGGILFRKAWELTPDVITQPTAHLRATTALPAEVEVSVDGTRISKTSVAPGPIEMDNLLLYGGTRTVRVTITDASGRREVIEQPFFFTASVLAQGLHDFSYFAGRRSELGSDNVIRYREAAWQAWHRYGVTDFLTAGAGGEGNPDFASGGAGITLRSDRLGLVSLDALGSLDRELARRARGWAARYTYVTPAWSFSVGRRLFGDGFRAFADLAGTPLTRAENSLGVATRIGPASLSADYIRSRDAVETRRSLTARVSGSLSERTTLSAEYQRTRINGEPAWAFNVSLRTTLDGNRWIGANTTFGPASRQVDIEAGQQLPQGEGVGYRVGSTLARQSGVESASGYFSGVWNTRNTTVEALASSTLRGPAARYAEVAVSGAVLVADGEVGLSRHVTDSFVLARLGVPQPGVKVFLNNQLQGTTDDAGRLFIPDLMPFVRQEVSVDERDLPMHYSVRQRQRTVTPASHSGSVVDLGGARVRAIAGIARFHENGQRTPVSARRLRLAGPQGTLEIETGTAGDFYVENPVPGSYAGTLANGARSYRCRFVVPDFPEAVHDSEEGIVCE